MILWLTGNTGSGKTTLAGKLASHDTVILDGDGVREIWPELGMSKEDRETSNCRVARLARLLEAQGLVVIVAVICPFKELRDEVRAICGCKFIYLSGGKEGTDYPYEVPEDAEIAVAVRREIYISEIHHFAARTGERVAIVPGEHRD